MALIKIIANNIVLDVVKETLNITKENNAFINDFKVSYTDYPFLIIENSKAIKALGGRDITSINKPKIVPVIVEELNERYYGELQILSYLNGFRKVTLKYSTELLKIMEKPIAGFMPVVSVIPGEINPVPFTEESSAVIPGYDQWTSYVSPFKDKSYPEVKFNFPMMYWKNKFGIDLAEDDEWINYLQHINCFDDTGVYLMNSFIDDEIITVDNKNVPSPQVYLLAPLFYALKTLDWTVDGAFVDSNFIKKITFLSFKNNLCKTTIAKEKVILNYPSLPLWTSTPLVFFYITYRTRIEYILPEDGKYSLDWMYTITDEAEDGELVRTYAEVSRSYESEFGGIVFEVEADKKRLFRNTTNGIGKVYEGTTELKGKAGDKIIISYFNLHQNMPIDYSLSIVKLVDAKSFHQFHPTIELGRYVPEWTFGTYLNEMKKLFNLKVEIDDFRKRVSLNFNEEIIELSQKVVLKKSLVIKEHDQPLYNAIHLKFQNKIDTSLWITALGVEFYSDQKSDFLDKPESKFKIVPNNGYTAELSEELEEKDGVGLMIYDSLYFPYISPSVGNQTLVMEGQYGIYETYWKKWLKFRLNASPVEITGYFTETELSKIQKAQRIHVDRQDYLVSVLEYSETEQDNFQVVLKLESVNF